MVSLLFRFASSLIKLKDVNLRHSGDTCLRQQTRDVTTEEIKSEEFQNLIDKMIAIMRENYGQGLAAPQVGSNLCLIVVEFADEDYKNCINYYGQREVEKRGMKIFPLTVLVNPIMRVVDFDKTTFEEGCLSLTATGLVERFKIVEMEALDRYGNNVQFRVDGWMARIFQHEMHHLKGLLISDYFVQKSRSWIKSRMR